MANIRLQDYVARIKEMVRGDQHDEAIAHCQHILKYHPKHIETYCLLGEACLEKEMVRESIEFFQRTLSADPENFIARVGMGIIYDGQGLPDEAIWQMERAFELVPGNAEVRQELQRLYAQRDGKEKSRLKLTRGALGRLYCRNGLYERAITEFRAVLRQEPDLPDVRVALVEALWREGRRLEAVEACLELLDALPNCLKANLILAEIWMRGGHEDASGEKLSLARALDPENLVAEEMMGRDSPLPPQEVLIPELASTAGMPMVIAADATVGAMPRGTEEGEIEAVDEETQMLEGGEDWETGDSLPDWLVDIGVTELAEAQVVDEVDIPDEQELLAEELPDWLTELTGEEAIPIVDEGVSPTEGEAAVVDGEIPGWPGEPVEPEISGVAAVEPTSDAEGVPDWLQEVQEPGVEEAAPSVADVLPAAGLAAAGAVLAAEILGGPEEEPSPAEEVPVADVPDWLREMQEMEAEEGASSISDVLIEEDALPTEEMPPWLGDLGAPEVEETMPEGTVEAPPAAGIPAEEETPSVEEIPDWLQDLEVPGEEEATDVLPAAGIAVAGTVAAAQVPDWLHELQGPEGEADVALPAEEVPEAAEAAPDAEVPDWLQDLEAPGAEESAPEEAADVLPVAGIAVAGAAAAAEMPDWLQELQGPEGEADVALPVEEVPEAVEAAPDAEVPDWLQDLEAPGVGESAPEEAADVLPAAGIAAAGAVAAAEVPDWLQELQGPEGEADVAPPAEGVPEAAEAAPDAEVPDWLQDLEAPGAEEPAPEEAADVLPAAGIVVAGAVSAAEIPDWLQELQGPEAEADVVPPAEEVPDAAEFAPDQDVPDWLQDLQEPEAEEATDALPAAGIAAAGAVAAAEIPDWLQELQEPDAVEEIAPPVEGIAEAVEVSAGEGLPDWLVESGALDEEPVAPSAEVVQAPRAAEEPVWLQDLMDEETLLAKDVAPPAPVAETVVDAPPEVEEVAPSISDVLPGVVVAAVASAEIYDRLKEAEESEVDKAEPEPEAAAPPDADAEAVPASLQALVDAGILDEADLETAMAEMTADDLEAQRAEQVPVWLQDLMDEEAPPAQDISLPDVEAPSSVEDPTEKLPAAEVPAWLQELEEPGAEEVSLPEVEGLPDVEVSERVPTVAVPAWLQELEEPEDGDISLPGAEALPIAEVPVEEAPTEEIPAWLRELEEPEAKDVTPPEVPVPETEGPPIAEVSDEPLPAWLQEFEEREAEEAVPLAEEMPEEPSSAETVDEDLPAWLREFEEGETDEVAPLVEEAPEEPPSAQVADEALPAWLRGFEERAEEKVTPPTAEAEIAEVGIPAVAAEAIPPLEEVLPSAEVPASLQALVDAGILDEADLEAAMAEMSEADLEGQRAEAVPEWLQDLMGEEDGPPPTVDVPEIEETVTPPAVEVFEETASVVEEVIPPPVIQVPEDVRPVTEEIVPPSVLVRPEIEPVLEQAVPVLEQDTQLAVEEEAPEPEVEVPVELPSVEESVPAPPTDMPMVGRFERMEIEEIVPVEAEEAPAPISEMPADVLPAEEPVSVDEQDVRAPAAETQVEVPTAEEVDLHEVEATAPPTEMEMVAPFERVEVEEESVQGSPVEELSALLESRPRDHKARLELARAYQAEQDWNAALGQYEKLVSARKLLPAVVDDLEAMADEDLDRSRLFQILGDAYMNEDRLEEALDMYRQAREALKKR